MRISCVKIADACRIPPQFFDEFVAATAKTFLMEDGEFLNVVRAYMY